MSEASHGYSVTDAARKLGVHRETLYRWLQSGYANGTRIGLGAGRWRLSAAEVERLAKLMEGEPPPEAGDGAAPAMAGATTSATILST
jgi:excisionase family DNA binding protein